MKENELPRLYIDTSVFGGCFDAEFSQDSKRLFEAAANGKAIFVVSDVVFEEVMKAPSQVKEVLAGIPNKALEVLTETAEVVELKNAYLSAKILGVRAKNDALHVAYATIARVDAIVSWNFKHIVRFDKMKAFNQVNFKSGYGMLEIVSPKEVLFDE